MGPPKELPLRDAALALLQIARNELQAAQVIKEQAVARLESAVAEDARLKTQVPRDLERARMYITARFLARQIGNDKSAAYFEGKLWQLIESYSP